MKNFKKRIIVKEKGKVVEDIILKENKFDYNIFKKHIIRIYLDHFVNEKLVYKAIEAAEKCGAEFIFVDVDKKNKKALAILKKKGFSEICTNILFRLCKKEKIKPTKTKIEIRRCRKKDLHLIKKIASKTYTASHFSLDKNFKDKTGLLYEKWAENDYKRRDVFVALKDDKIIGFLSYSKTKNKGKKIANIGLVRIAKKYQGQGFGNALLNFSLKKLSNFDEIYIGTAEDNPNALRIYKKNNFSPVKKNVSFHKKL